MVVWGGSILAAILLTTALIAYIAYQCIKRKLRRDYAALEKSPNGEALLKIRKAQRMRSHFADYTFDKHQTRLFAVASFVVGLLVFFIVFFDPQVAGWVATEFIGVPKFLLAYAFTVGSQSCA
jgi:hypothetical protein